MKPRVLRHPGTSPRTRLRRLIYVPIVHSEADMGSMAPQMQKEFAQKLGVHHWRQHVRAVDEMWAGIEKKILALELDFQKVRVYQDGLPVCGKEVVIVHDVAAKGSKNYQIVQHLLKRGAQVEGTEDPMLLMKEYSYIKLALAIADLEARKKKMKEVVHERDTLLEKRDRYIAGRISETLQLGETGILFMGIIHRIDRYLPKDIQVEYLISRLPFQGLKKETLL